MNIRLLLCILLANILPSETATAKIGYGSSTAIVTEKIQEGFLMGFELGLRETVGTKKANEILLKKQIVTTSQLGATESASELVKMGAVALFGFPGSHDALLAGQIAKEAEILAFFPGCNHNDLANLGPDIHSTGHSMNEEVAFILSKAKKLFTTKEGLVVINPIAAPSQNQESIFLNLKKRLGANITITKLNKDLLLNELELSKLKNNNYAYIILTAYPEAQIALSKQLTENGIDIPTIAGSAWGTVDSDVMRRYVALKKSAFYMLSSWERGTKSSLVFESKFKKIYGRDPTPENAYGYDLGVIAGTLLNKVKGSLTKDSLKAALKKDRCFENLSSGKICLNEKGGHSNRLIHFLKYTNQGYLPLKMGP